MVGGILITEQWLFADIVIRNWANMIAHLSFFEIPINTRHLVQIDYKINYYLW